MPGYSKNQLDVFRLLENANEISGKVCVIDLMNDDEKSKGIRARVLRNVSRRQRGVLSSEKRRLDTIDSFLRLLRGFWSVRFFVYVRSSWMDVRKSAADEGARSIRNPLVFEVYESFNEARAGEMTLPHGPVETPVFMPVSTQGAYKGLTSQQMEELGISITLGNTYHLGNRPGSNVVRDLGGLHRFMGWKRNILTDSGGFQMVSLTKLSRVTEKGVQFQSPYDDSMMFLSPEQSISIQNDLGADIIMQLDDVVSATLPDRARVEEAMYRSVRWLDRCIKAHRNPHTQNLFGIVQGGLHGDLRKVSVEQLVKRDLNGYAIGGLSGGEEKDIFWRMVHLSTKGLPRTKPRYLMGVGYAVDLVVCVALGVDAFDCVYVARTARFGNALVSGGTIRIKGGQYEKDFGPLDEKCDCRVCSRFSRAFIHQAFREEVGIHLVTYHNVHYVTSLMRNVRRALMEKRFTQFVVSFMDDHFPERVYPDWVVDALDCAGIRLPNVRPTLRRIRESVESSERRKRMKSDNTASADD